MSTTHTLIAAIAITLISPTVIPEAQPPVTTAAGSPEPTPAVVALSPGTTRESPDRTPDADVTIELLGATVYAETTSQVEMVEWSLSRYADHNLDLPHVTIEMRSIGKCPTHDGGQLSGSTSIRDGEFWIKVCGTERTLLHELGHVWDNHNLTDTTRDDYRALRNLESWSHSDWHLAGGEHLAETMTWALDDTYLPPSRIDQTTVAELAAAYELLTGTDAPILSIAPLQRRTAEPVGDRELLDSEALIDGESMG